MTSIAYLSFLQWVLSLGPAIPTVIVEIQNIAESMQRIRIALGFVEPQPLTEEPAVVPQEIVDCENKIAEQLPSAPGTQAMFDGSRLRKAFAFLQSSGLLDLLLKQAAARVLGG